ncbi:flavin reductase family protein [Yinghuangia seranimata]|uniref:flavin reductase family protein n=1 Tax=Yinghuangia seranimata TaxID=408067 RepID=UPI00248CAA52|nr:flavin reductase family protein [Yinghuangia seranimata]MDI2128299.1 flavin reductase family protein [Yinghuangia seranimata]
MAFDEFTDALDYPVFVVTAVDTATGERAGCLVGFATQCSLEPARFLVCLSTANHTYRVARASPVLAVHALGVTQHGLARLFGERTGDTTDKFAQCRWEPGEAGVPLLSDCPQRFIGRVLHRVDNLGDHAGFVLAPAESAPDVATDNTVPGLLMFSQVQDLTPGHPA